MGLIDFPDPVSMFEGAKTANLERQVVNSVMSAMYSSWISFVWRSGSAKWADWTGRRSSHERRGHRHVSVIARTGSKKLSEPDGSTGPVKAREPFQISNRGDEKMSTNKFQGAIAKAVAASEKVKAEVVKAASEVDGVLVKVEADAPEIEAVANAFVPGASSFVTLGISVLEGLASVLDSGSAAAEQNLLNAGLDSSLVAAVKAQLANIKKL